MKTKQIIKRRHILISALLVLMLSSFTGYAQYELKTSYPIIFVHGLAGSNETWSEIKGFLESEIGYRYGGQLNFCLNQDNNLYTSKLPEDYKDWTGIGGNPNINRGDFYIVNFDVDETGKPQGKDIRSNQSAIVKQGWAIRDAVKRVIETTGAKKVILVGHSMGGLASREYLQNKALWYEPNIDHHVAKLLTIATPHGGSNATDFGMNLVSDLTSEAVRDLRTNYFYSYNFPFPANIYAPGTYLFGGIEDLNYMRDQNFKFYNADVNCDGNGNGEAIAGLNFRYYKKDLAYTCIVGTGHFLGGDGVVSAKSANINNYLPVNAEVYIINNTLDIDLHRNLKNNLLAITKGLDEPNTKELAYEIKEVSSIKGFVTQQTSISSWDLDYFKITPSKNGTLTLNIFSTIFPLKRVELIDDSGVLYSTANASAVEYTIDADPSQTYFLKIIGEPSSGGIEGYILPYTIQSSFTATTPAVLLVSPTSLQYNDVVIGSPKNKIITLDNKGTTDILINSIAKTGSNVDQFSVSPMPPFVVTPSTNQNLTVTFNPTSLGAKVATIEITANSPEIPIKKITLSGNGVANETKVLVTTPALSYLFDDTKVGISISKTITLKNTGSNNCTINNITLGGNYPADFAITSSLTFPFDIGTGAIKQFTIQFNPTSIGAKAAMLVIDNNSDNAPIKNIELYGNGLEFPYSGNNNTLTAYEYWFDDQYNAKITTAVNSYGDVILNTQFNTDLLNIGLHSLHIRYKDKKGKWSAVLSEYFHKQPITKDGPRKITSNEYWFDDNYSEKVTTPITPNQTITLNSTFDTTILTEGLHSYHVRYKDDEGHWSSVVSEFFYKIKANSLPTNLITGYRYWYDLEDSKMKVTSLATPITPYQLIKDISTCGLLAGSHTINLQFKDARNSWSAVFTNTFDVSVDSIGCSDPQLDDDNDTVINDVDLCPNTPIGEVVDVNGCSTSQLDTDNDGIKDNLDTCPSTPTGQTVNATGCSSSQLDTDNDGIKDNLDTCPNTPIGQAVNVNGCSTSQLDTDNDGIKDNLDLCPNTPIGQAVNVNGCSTSQLDTDNDGIKDNLDTCPNTPSGTNVDANGCFFLPSNNFSIEVIGETCVDKNNGKINISAQATHNYVATINGANHNFANNNLSVSNLSPGTYNVCIKITGVTYEQCFTITVAEGKTISGKSSVTSNKTSIDIAEGTAPYNVSINGINVLNTLSPSFMLEVKHGDLVEVKTAVLCEGIFSKTIDLFEGITVYPNPTNGLFEIALPLSLKEVKIELFTASSQLISSKTYSVINGKVQFNIENLPAAVYFAKVYMENPVLVKIIKK